MKHCHTSVYHWNGRSWSTFTVPTFADGISGTAGNVWICGQFGGDMSPPATPGRPVAYRWTGAAWTKVTSMPGPLSFFPASISVVSRDNVWLGAILNGPAGRQPGYLLHWNGRGWRQINAPASLTTTPDGPVVADGTGGAWFGADAHWTGSHWVNTTPARAFVGTAVPFFEDLARIPGRTALWGAGGVTPTRTSRAANSLIGVYGKAP
jgi:hypothetical protein